MSPRKHFLSSRLMGAVALTSSLMAFASCGGSDSVGALGNGGSAGSSASTGASSGGANGTGGSVGQGGVIGSGGAVVATGGVTSGVGGSGSGGQIKPDADVRTDSSINADASALAQLCYATGGQPQTKDCCGAVGDYPDMCSVGACACSPSGSHSVTVCACQNMGCFSRTAGCNLGVGGSGGSTGARADAATLTDLCLATGGSLANQQACLAVTEFPNTCLEAACSPANSHTVTGCACPSGCFSPSSGCGPLSGGTGGAAGSGGSGGAGGNTGVKLDAPVVSTDAAVLAELCSATGGTIESKSCCASASAFPDSCMGGACGCAPEHSHDISVCTCPTGTCFSYSLGCAGRDAGGTTDASPCTAQPSLDSYCGGSKPPHYYSCVMTVPSECSIVSIGDMTNGVCCP